MYFCINVREVLISWNKIIHCNVCIYIYIVFNSWWAENLNIFLLVLNHIKQLYGYSLANSFFHFSVEHTIFIILLVVKPLLDFACWSIWLYNYFTIIVLIKNKIKKHKNLVISIVTCNWAFKPSQVYMLMICLWWLKTGVILFNPSLSSCLARVASVLYADIPLYFVITIKQHNSETLHKFWNWSSISCVYINTKTILKKKLCIFMKIFLPNCLNLNFLHFSKHTAF